jgi:hypothetical protein
VSSLPNFYGADALTASQVPRLLLFPQAIVLALPIQINPVLSLCIHTNLVLLCIQINVVWMVDIVLVYAFVDWRVAGVCTESQHWSRVWECLQIHRLLPYFPNLPCWIWHFHSRCHAVGSSCWYMSFSFLLFAGACTVIIITVFLATSWQNSLLSPVAGAFVL